MNREQNKKQNRSKLQVIPCSFRAAKKYVSTLHRHHRPSVGQKFSLAVIDENMDVRGVAICGRPVARKIDDGFTLEVTRVATDGCPNACSALYGAAARAAKAMGYNRIITYTLPQEGGASLRGAGWCEAGIVVGMSWKDRYNPEWQGIGKRKNDWPTCDKTRWVKELNPTKNSWLDKSDIVWPHMKVVSDNILDFFSE